MWAKIFLFYATVFVLFLLWYPETNPDAHFIATMTQDMKDDLEDCRLEGGDPVKCRRMIEIWQTADMPVEDATPRCDAARINAMKMCLVKLEEQSYGGGEVVYEAVKKAEQYPVCERLGTNAYVACDNY